MNDIYVNKNGFKCVLSQLAKTDGRDPQEYEECCRRYGHDRNLFEQEKNKLRVRESKYQ